MCKLKPKKCFFVLSFGLDIFNLFDYNMCSCLYLGIKTVGNGRKNTSTVFIFIFTLRDENENEIYR
jgi:hypothetical protein